MKRPKAGQVLVLTASAGLLVLLAAAGAGRAQGPPAGFPQASVDYFAAMDDGVALSPEQVRGRNTWLMWTAGDEAFWDYLARRSFGTFDLLKVLDSRTRATRFSYYGLMNEPGFKQATAPDRYGLWLDLPDGTQDGASPRTIARISRARIFCAFTAAPPASSVCGCFPIQISTRRRNGNGWRRSRAIQKPSTAIGNSSATASWCGPTASAWLAAFAMSARTRCIRRPIQNTRNGKICRAISALNI